MLFRSLSLAGVPPFSGFVAKLSLAQAGFAINRYAIVGVSLLVGLLTLFSMAKIWAGAFWSPAPVDSDPSPARLPWVMVGATATVVVMSLAIAVLAGPMYNLTEHAARELTNPSLYVGAVLGR